MAKKKPMTTAELFEKIDGILKGKGKRPDILDYGLATHRPVPVMTYEFDIRNNLDYGHNEGIYLDLWIEYCEGGEKVLKGLGTYKTLSEDEEGMYAMAKLLADFVIEENRFVNGNLDDFTWQGADVHIFDKDDNSIGWGYTCSSMERAIKKKDEMLGKYPKVVIRDNVTRKKKIYTRQCGSGTDVIEVEEGGQRE